ncbi:unnamed protein product (macronuclear) [Paramecium tetraurelia]|uniref:Uncharacterized protein n=1 Tax=Paramecium tetraurelia TaxID=5888 RepID=A0CBR1_PARTE|nr:uncharacterized protein GSPATT00037011001 [Paramecium tetraurelia]CAK68228.1 unnamed protein product [Paramecium tetraurelia]|eukprot:XP_001435625.1 hypothetical protein (macronuclear) [Paramecium tetraurelia strain d4-2]
MQKQQALAVVRAPSGITKQPFKSIVTTNQAPLQRVNSSGFMSASRQSNQFQKPSTPFYYTNNYRQDWKNYLRSFPSIPKIKILAPGTGYDAKMIK